jgi:hypothetical protein
MDQINITLITELLQGTFSKSGKDEAFIKLLEEILDGHGEIIGLRLADSVGQKIAGASFSPA